uniref:SHSP domain-containing protein n=1 Tax=Nelumbo nucifera TaxID=4432 RepID=A0A822XSH6_NELNU|nr:TPA_asm: hypothetical protein HUJ06_024425 [Nelumbo nucifera]
MGSFSNNRDNATNDGDDGDDGENDGEPFCLQQHLAIADASYEREGVTTTGGTPWEIKEGEQGYKMKFDMPGMTRNDVKVWVEEKMLVVKVEKVPKKKVEDGQQGIE